jgi:hypothetical protein
MAQEQVSSCAVDNPIINDAYEEPALWQGLSGRVGQPTLRVGQSPPQPRGQEKGRTI